VFSIPDLQRIFRENKVLWAIPGTTKAEEFIKHLIEKKTITKIEIKLPREEKLNKYICENPSIFEIALSIKSKSYLSHYTAMFLHGLTDNIPKTIYTNTELKKTKNLNTKKLVQGSIDKAFGCNMRQSNQIAKLNEVEIYLLNSKNVDQIGVKKFTLNGVKLLVTDIERTLIDIAVRPNYAGGIAEVLNAYIAAKDRVSVNRMVSILKKLDYTYPYHQAIGFYLEKAGYNKSVLKLLEKIEIKHKFYLTYKIKEKDYSKKWKLFFPKVF